MPYRTSPSYTPLLPENSVYEFRALDELQATPLRIAAAYWTQVRGDRRFPARDSLRPRDIATLLPYMSLLKVIDGGADFQHRIVGDIVVRAFRVVMQNRRFSEIAQDAPSMVQRCLPLFQKVVETGAPLAWANFTGHDAAHVNYSYSEVLLLPLGRSDNEVDHVVVFASYETCF